MSNIYQLHVRDIHNDHLYTVTMDGLKVIRIMKYTSPYDQTGILVKWADLSNGVKDEIVKGINDRRK